MDLKSLLQRVDDIESNAPSFKKYINESVYQTPEMIKHWRKLDEGFFKGYDRYLQEVALTPDQIQGIFKQAGGGAGADAAKDPGKLAAIVDKVLPSSQAANLEKSLPEPDAGPVQGFEQKAASAVQSLPGVDSGTKQSLMQLVKAGIKKPETQQLILAAVGAGLGSLISKVGPVLSMIPGGGPIASAITGAVVAGGVAVLAAKLRGEDWKSAFKGAIKPALMGGASAVIGNLATTAISSMTGGSDAQPAADTTEKPAGASLGVGQELPGGEVISALDSSNPNSGVTITKPDGSTYSVSRDTAQAMTGQQGVSTQATSGAPVSQGASSDPRAGVTDKTPMTLDQINAAKDALRTGNATDMSAPMNAPAGAIEPRGGYGAQEKINQMMQAKVDADYAAKQAAPIGSNFDAGIAPLGPDGTPMKAVPMDTGPTAGGVPVGSTEPGINRLTGKPISSGPTWDQMTPDQQAAVTARQQQQAADAAQGAQNAKDYWANKNPNTRGLKESFAESTYVDKQATLRMWLDQEARGLAVTGLMLKPAVMEGILDSIKGMFGGKKDAAAPAGATVDSLNQAWKAAGSPTDSEELAKILQGAGVAPDVVSKIYADLKIPAPGTQPAANAAPAADAASANEPQQGAAAAAPVDMKASEIVSSLQDFWNKATASQGSQTSAPAVQQQIKAMAKAAGMTGQTVESKQTKFYSKFLGKEI